MASENQARRVIGFRLQSVSDVVHAPGMRCLVPAAGPFRACRLESKVLLAVALATPDYAEQAKKASEKAWRALLKRGRCV